MRITYDCSFFVTCSNGMFSGILVTLGFRMCRSEMVGVNGGGGWTEQLEVIDRLPVHNILSVKFVIPGCEQANDER